MGTVRSDWLTRADAAVERLAEDLTTIDVRDSRFLLVHFIETVETPPDALHGAVLSTILMDACGRIVQALHEQDRPLSCTCDKTIWSHVSRFAKWRDADPRMAFRDWIDVFFAGIDQEHPADFAVRAARVVRRDPQQTWTLETLAAAVGARPVVLRREFEHRFGVRPTAYVHLARVTWAIGLLRGPAKVQTVAADVGYRSKKDLYAALSRWTDATPTELRALTDEEFGWLERELRQRCLRGVINRFSVGAVVGTFATAGGPGAASTRASRR